MKIPELAVPINLSCGLKGRFRLQTVKASTGEITKDTGWFDNIITNAGLNRLGTDTTNWGVTFAVGTGSATPLATNIDLNNRIATTTTFQAQTLGAITEEPYGCFRRLTRRFGEGVAAGNLTEVGVGFGTLPAFTAFSHALIVDSLGDPTTLTVLSDEFLDVTYELRVLAPSVDVVGTLSGYDFTLRAAYAATHSDSNPISGWDADPTPGSGPSLVGNLFARVSEGPISTVLSGPTLVGTPTATSTADDAYVNNSLTRTGNIFYGLNDGNLAGGIQSIQYRHGFGCWQIGFSPVIDKDNTKTLRFNVRISWSRAS